MNRYAWGGLAASILGAAVTLWVAKLIAPAWAPAGPLIPQQLYQAGPFLFLALMIFRRRTSPEGSRFLLNVAVFVAVLGWSVLGYDLVRFRNENPQNHATHSHPLILPLIQWLLVMGSWILLGLSERREKGAAEQTEAK